jgi:hypothetical protein
MYFSEQALADMRAELARIPQKHAALMDAYLQRNYLQARAKEFAQHGYLRRLKTLARCIENVFRDLPPDQVEPPEREVRHDAEINIQAAVFNAFAVADNLAWVWVVERGVTRPDGRPLPDTWVGLRANNEVVRDSMPQALRDYLATMDQWFDGLESFRQRVGASDSAIYPALCRPHGERASIRRPRCTQAPGAS